MLRHHLVVTSAVAAFLAGITMGGAGGAQAQNNCPGVSATQCEEFCAQSGAEVLSCEKTGSEPDCVCTEETKNVPGNAFGTATQTGASGQGNLGNKTEEAPCTGNQGQCKQQ
jgi:hypothetical protein